VTEAPDIPRALWADLHRAVFDLCLVVMGSNPDLLEQIAEQIDLEDKPEEVRHLIVAYSAYYSELF
jgi:hypothetical protein